LRNCCCLGCLTLIVLAVSLMALLFTVVMDTGALETYERQNAVAEVSGKPSVVVRLDLQSPSARPFLSMLMEDSAGYLTDFFIDSLPWEAVIALTPDRDAKAVRMGSILSMRRFSGLLEARADAELWRWFPGQKVDSLELERPGIFVVRSTLPLSEEAMNEASVRWSKPAGDALQVPEGAPLGAYIDNRDGRGYLALEPILNPPPQPGDRPGAREGQLDAAGWAPYFERFTEASGALGFDTDGMVTVELRLKAPGEQAAKDLLALLEAQRDSMGAEIERQGGWLEGAWSRQGSEVSGSFRVQKGQQLLKTFVQRRIL
jgi:hypothetical protein